MKRIPLPLLVLLTASLFSGMPAIADTAEETWEIGIQASNPETLVSPDLRYCVMPDSMPIRPGNDIVLQDADHHVLGTAQLQDVVAAVGPMLHLEARQPCGLFTLFPPVAPQAGLRIVIKPDPAPPAPSPSSGVYIDAVIQAYGPFDWSYDEYGFKRCQLLGNVQLTDGSPVVTSPDSLLRDLPDPRALRFITSVAYDQLRGEEYCALMATLEFPIADEYVIEFGGEVQDAQ